MALDYFVDYQTPNDYYHELAQAFICDSWDNTAAKAPENGGTIYEQDVIGTESYHPIEAWVKNTVGDVTRGMTDNHDFLKLYFKDIGHTVQRGLMYKFNNSYWLVNDNNHFSGIAQEAGIRRCNNWLKIVDPDNGSVFSIPCIVEYDMQSPSISVNRYVLTPNNHATVMVQGNPDTLRLFKLNTRYILSGRPFKLFAYQNALNLDLDTNYDTLLYLDLYLDEVHDKDDIEIQLADNGEYVYTINIENGDMTLVNGYGGLFNATVTLNGLEVNRDIIWESNNTDIVKVDNDGNFEVSGGDGTYAIITATLKGNKDVSSSIRVTVGVFEKEENKVLLSPEFAKVRQNEEMNFIVSVLYHGYERMPDKVDIGLETLGYFDVDVKENNVTLVCKKLNKYPIMMTIRAKVDNEWIETQRAVQTVSMFG